MGEFPNKDTQFKEGNTASVGHGRPMGETLQQIAKKILALPVEKRSDLTEILEKKSVAYHMMTKHAAKGLDGDVQSTNVVFDRYEGKAVNRSEGGEKGEFLQFLDEIEEEAEKDGN